MSFGGSAHTEMHCRNGSSRVTILDTEATGLIGPAEGQLNTSSAKSRRKRKQLGAGAAHLCNKGIHAEVRLAFHAKQPGHLPDRESWDQHRSIRTPRTTSRNCTCFCDKTSFRGAALEVALPRELDEFFFPKKLPPLKLESKPEPVKRHLGLLQQQEKWRARFDRRSRSDSRNHRSRHTWSDAAS